MSEQEKEPEQLPQKKKPDTTYFDERMAAMRIDPEKFQFKRATQGPGGAGDLVYENVPAFTCDEHGNIQIHYYDHRGVMCDFRRGENKWAEPFIQTRLRAPVVAKDGKVMKYAYPKGAPSFPWLPPALIEKAVNKTPIKTLVLTEGAFKAAMASQYGLDIVGLGSISLYRDKESGALHYSVLEIIKDCKVQNVIWLQDGDCLDISAKFPEDPEIDLYTRPNQFFQSARNVRELLIDYDLQVFFAHVQSDQFADKAKGLDDALISVSKESKKPEEDIARVLEDLTSLSRPAVLFWRVNISYGMESLRKHFCLDSVDSFYHRHVQKLEGKKWIFHGTKYEYDGQEGKAKVIVPGQAKLFLRIGVDYYKKIERPDKHNGSYEIIKKWSKAEIVQDHGKHLFDHILKLNDFCNVPDHENYQPIIRNCYNTYHPFEHKEREENGDWSVTKGFLEHIFGKGTVKYRHPRTKEMKEVSELDIGIDYIQLLYKQPTQILPILVLVSKENNTGKSTLAKYLKVLFGQNAVFVGNSDLSNDFNASWSSRLLIMCEEVLIDKKLVMEKIKSLSTGDRIMMNAKGKDQAEMEFYGKFIFMSNNETSFAQVGPEDIRFWVRKIPPIPTENLNQNLLEQIVGEIPAFLDYMDKRKMATEKLTRMHFLPEMVHTEALRKAQEYNRPTIMKELHEHLSDLFDVWADDEIQMSVKDIKVEFFGPRIEDNYIRRMLKDDMKLEPSDKTLRYRYPRFHRKYEEGRVENVVQEVSSQGRPYTFKRQQFTDFAYTPVEDTTVKKLNKEFDEKMKQSKELFSPAPDSDDNEETPF